MADAVNSTQDRARLNDILADAFKKLEGAIINLTTLAQINKSIVEVSTRDVARLSSDSYAIASSSVAMLEQVSYNLCQGVERFSEEYYSFLEGPKHPIAEPRQKKMLNDEHRVADHIFAVAPCGAWHLARAKVLLAVAEGMDGFSGVAPAFSAMRKADAAVEKAEPLSIDSAADLVHIAATILSDREVSTGVSDASPVKILRHVEAALKLADPDIAVGRAAESTSVSA